VIDLARDVVIPAAYRLLPAAMGTPAATRQLLAIGYQESRFEHRRQIKGPARGLWQFERGGGVAAVLSHRSTKHALATAWRELQYPGAPTADACYAAIEHNDILAAVFARLLLWPLPFALPTTEADGWDQYLEAWRPGRPHRETWPTAWRIASAA
jgi:hypothetical protein